MSTALSSMARRTGEPPISWLMRLTLENKQLCSLAAGFTDNESLPVAEVRELMAKLLSDTPQGRGALQYGSTVGDAELRQLTAAALGSADHTKVRSDEVVITNGSQQLLYLVTEALCDEGDLVIVEDPTYFVYLGILQSRGVKTCGVAMDEHGMKVDALKERLELLKRSGDLKRLKMLYLVTYFQNPSGISTSAERKQQLAALLRSYERHAGHPIYLLEDAAYRELRFAGTGEVASALSHQRRDRLLYAGTYSKPFATGARVGFGVLPEPVRTAVVRLKGNHDFGKANLLQRLLLAALQTGVYEKHVKTLRQRYQAKAQVMSRALKASFPKLVRYAEAEGGLYFWAALPRKVATGSRSALFRKALASEVLYVPGELCYADDTTRRKPNNEMRLSFGGATEKNIVAGIERLGTTLNEVLG